MLLGLVPVLAEPAEVNWPVLELIEKMETVELLKFVTYTNFPEGSMLTDDGLLVLKTPPVICARLPSPSARGSSTTSTGRHREFTSRTSADDLS